MTRPAVLIMNRMLAPLSPFLETQFDVYRLWEGPPVEAASDIRAIVTAGEEPLDKPVIEKLPNLELVACFTAGYDGLDIEWCRQRGLKLSHSPNVNHEDVADLAMGLILAARREIVAGHAKVLTGDWSLEQRNITGSLQGQKVGIVGLGAIGEAVARRASAFNLEVQWWGPRPKQTAWKRADSLKQLASDTDILVVACRADDSNRGLIDADVIQAVGPQGIIVNVSRGSLVNEDALIAALKTGQLGGAALDVFETEPTPSSRWIDVPNILLSPHAGGATTNGVQGMLLLTLQNLSAHFAGQPLVTPIPE
ncbi:2-hydroxyacid dehydrogenase [uncultured Brevundimonas sp.]|uniref:2-hydroxyacid dehydrogenase n=1 Tax=uncultured Brevundimonas sp. TaxID=213418 RepID=UPI0026164586|nr:2-hydroxyacid dehydrogenase [uncultured Brevundimonas sp.]